MGFPLKTLGAAALVAVMGTASSAATLSIDNGFSGSIPGGIDGAPTTANQVLTDVLGLSTLDGFFGSSISVDEDAKVKVEFIGFEAGAINTFTMGGNTVTTTGGSDLSGLISSFTVNALAGNLDFTFGSSVGGGKTLSNGAANTNPGFNFFASFGDGTTRSGNELLLFLDDGGKNPLGGIDDNHDDLVVRVSVVPLPAGVLLLLTGMGGLAVASRRKSA